MIFVPHVLLEFPDVVAEPQPETGFLQPSVSLQNFRRNGLAHVLEIRDFRRQFCCTGNLELLSDGLN